MKLAEWTRVDRVHPQTTYQWFRQDRMPVPARLLASGTLWVDAAPTDESGRVVVDARVSWHDHRADLDRKVARVTGWATSNGRRVNEVACEAGSGMNGNWPELRRILPDPPATVLMCARLYGRRGAGNRAIRAIIAARRGDEAEAA